MLKPLILSLLAVLLINPVFVKSQEIKVLNNVSAFLSDSVYNSVRIGDSLFVITILRDASAQKAKFGGDTTMSQLPIILQIAQSKQTAVVFKQRFSFDDDVHAPFLNYFLFKTAERELDKTGELFLSINKSYGGSGSVDNTYHISLKEDRVQLRHLFQSSGELDYIVFSNEDKLILLQGIWARGESHYEAHKYKVRTFKYVKGDWLEQNSINTKRKYPTLDIDQKPAQLLQQMKVKEPTLFKSLN